MVCDPSAGQPPCATTHGVTSLFLFLPPGHRDPSRLAVWCSLVSGGPLLLFLDIPLFPSLCDVTVPEWEKSAVTGAGGLGEGMLLVWEVEGWMGKIICGVGQR